MTIYSITCMPSRDITFIQIIYFSVSSTVFRLCKHCNLVLLKKVVKSSVWLLDLSAILFLVSLSSYLTSLCSNKYVVFSYFPLLRGTCVQSGAISIIKILCSSITRYMYMYMLTFYRSSCLSLCYQISSNHVFLWFVLWNSVSFFLPQTKYSKLIHVGEVSSVDSLKQ